jgi:hypothetical protein
MTATYLSIYRRTATVYASRETSTIFSVKDFSDPIAQSIAAQDFLTAFDSVIIPWVGQPYQCQESGPSFQLTTGLFTDLDLGLEAPESTIPLDRLRNLFATALFVSTPLFVTSTLTVDTVQPDLPAENYFQGSYATPIDHIVPAQWTAITFTACGAFTFVVILVGVGLSYISKGPEISQFPFLNTSKLRWERIGPQVEPGDAMAGSNLVDSYRNIDLTDDSEVLKRAADIKVFLNTDVGEGKREV